MSKFVPRPSPQLLEYLKNVQRRFHNNEVERKKAKLRKAHEARHTFGNELKETREQIADYLKREPKRRDY